MALPDSEIQAQIRREWDDALAEICRNPPPPHRFSRSFEQEMELLIRPSRPFWKKFCRAAALFLLCGTAVFSGVLTVKAVQEQVTRLLTTVFSGYTRIEISAEGLEPAEMIPPELRYLPDGMEQTDCSAYGDSLRMRWENGTDSLQIVQRSLTGNAPLRIDLDTENAQTVQASINGNDITLIFKDHRIQAVWMDSPYFMTLSATLPFEEVQKILENIVIK